MECQDCKKHDDRSNSGYYEKCGNSSKLQAIVDINYLLAWPFSGISLTQVIKTCIFTTICNTV